MKVNLQVTPKITVEADGQTHTDIFEQLASLQEVFVATMKCSRCGSKRKIGSAKEGLAGTVSTAVRLVVRTNTADEKFYEAHCQNPDCRARLSFGQNKKPEGQLYPRTKENNKCTVMKGATNPKTKKPYVKGDWLPYSGWLRWNKEKDCHE